MCSVPSSNSVLPNVFCFLPAISKFCKQALGYLNARCEDFKAVSGFGLQCVISGTENLMQTARSSEMLLNVKNLNITYINEYGWVVRICWCFHWRFFLFVFRILSLLIQFIYDTVLSHKNLNTLIAFMSYKFNNNNNNNIYFILSSCVIQIRNLLWIGLLLLPQCFHMSITQCLDT